MTTWHSEHYPAGWPDIAREIKEACDWCCLECGKQCRRPGEFYLGWEYELAAAHICQDYEGEAVNVAALCGRCHLAFDAGHSWIARQRRERWRRGQAGQLMIGLNAH